MTPTITHWYSTGLNTHTAQIGILNLRVVPEPGRVALLALGLGALLALRRWGVRASYGPRRGSGCRQPLSPPDRPEGQGASGSLPRA